MRIIFFVIVLLITNSQVCYSKNSFNLLTWNIFMIPAPANFSKQKKRIPLIIENLIANSNDIVILQEAFDQDIVDKLINSLKKIYPYHERLIKKEKFYQVLPSGVLVFSKFPLKILDEVVYNECNHVDCFAAKGFLLLEVTLESNHKIQLGCTHLQSRTELKHQTTRYSQLLQIKKSIDKFHSSDIPLILAGDFNIEFDSPEFPKLKEMLAINQVITDKGLSVTTAPVNTCYNTPGTSDEAPKWIDYIFLLKKNAKINLTNIKVRNFLGFIENKYCTLSDHFAVQGTVHYE